MQVSKSSYFSKLYKKILEEEFHNNCLIGIWRTLTMMVLITFSVVSQFREVLEKLFNLLLCNWIVETRIYIVHSTIIYSMFRHLYIRQIGYLLWAGSEWGVSMSLNIFKVSRAKVGPWPRAWVSVMANIKSNLRNLFKSLCINTRTFKFQTVL